MRAGRAAYITFERKSRSTRRASDQTNLVACWPVLCEIFSFLIGTRLPATGLMSRSFFVFFFDTGLALVAGRVWPWVWHNFPCREPCSTNGRSSIGSLRSINRSSCGGRRHEAILFCAPATARSAAISKRDSSSLIGAVCVLPEASPNAIAGRPRLPEHGGSSTVLREDTC